MNIVPTSLCQNELSDADWHFLARKLIPDSQGLLLDNESCSCIVQSTFLTTAYEYVLRPVSSRSFPEVTVLVLLDIVFLAVLSLYRFLCCRVVAMAKVLQFLTLLTLTITVTVAYKQSVSAKGQFTCGSKLATGNDTWVKILNKSEFRLHFVEYKGSKIELVGIGFDDQDYVAVQPNGTFEITLSVDRSFELTPELHIYTDCNDALLGIDKVCFLGLVQLTGNTTLRFFRVARERSKSKFLRNTSAKITASNPLMTSANITWSRNLKMKNAIAAGEGRSAARNAGRDRNDQ